MDIVKKGQRKGQRKVQRNENPEEPGNPKNPGNPGEPEDKYSHHLSVNPNKEAIPAKKKSPYNCFTSSLELKK